MPELIHFGSERKQHLSSIVSVLQSSKILGCVIGNNSYIGEGCTVEKSLDLGNDYYTNEKTRAASIEKGESALGVGMSSLTLSFDVI